MKRMLPAGVLPRNLSLRQTAEFWGVSYNTFRRLVRDGIAPPPMNVPELGRMLFDREQQDRAIDALRSRVAAMGAATFKIKVLPKGMAKKGEASHAHD